MILHKSSIEGKVTIVTDWNCKSGIYTYSKYLIEKLNNYVRVEIIPIEFHRLFDIVHFSPKNFSPRGILSFLKLVKKILNANKKSVILHFQEPVWAFAPIILLLILIIKKVKVVTTIHEIYFEDEDKPLILRIHRKIVNWLIRKTSDILIAHSDFMRHLIKSGMDLVMEKIIVIPHGAYSNPVILDKNLCKAKLGLSRNRIITIFGFIDERKGYDKILRILPKLDRDIVLLVAGGLPNPHSKSQKACFEKLKRYENTGRVKITGYLDDELLPVVFNASDVLLFPYTRVTQSGALNITLAYRKPIITSDLPYFRELKENYRCIEIARDEDEFLEKIKEILENEKLKKKLSISVYRYWTRNKWEEVAKKHVDVYRRLLNE